MGDLEKMTHGGLREMQNLLSQQGKGKFSQEQHAQCQKLQAEKRQQAERRKKQEEDEKRRLEEKRQEARGGKEKEGRGKQAAKGGKAFGDIATFDDPQYKFLRERLKALKGCLGKIIFRQGEFLGQ